MAQDTSPLFLGLDLSTQALKASLLDINLNGIDEALVRFDVDLPMYETCGGILPQGHALLDEPDAAASPAMMYLAAMDKLWDRVKHERRWPIERIAAISAAGQQHASVYLAEGATHKLQQVRSDMPLANQLDTTFFSRATVPNWQDATTLQECDELMAAADKAFDEPSPALCRVTGSIAHTRFTAAQILRWRRARPDEYAHTQTIALVSNFVATLLTAGRDVVMAPIDQSDACGMNLYDMRQRAWSKELLAFVAGGAEHAADLEAKLGVVATDPRHIVARAGTWFQERYGVSPDCLVCQATGDNPATLQCLTPLFGEAVLSLGTSDTILLPSRDYAPDVHFHTFEHPASSHSHDKETTPPYFQMFVYKNGSLAREWVRDTYCHGTWTEFNEAMHASPTPSHGTGFYWRRPEIIPWNASGVHRFAPDGQRLEEFAEPTYNAAAMVQSQAMSFKTRIGHVLTKANVPLERVYVVGGAAENQALCQVLANVLHCPIARPLIQGRSAETGERVPYNYCSVGAAFRARWVWECAAKEHTEVSFEACVAQARGEAGAVTYTVIATPQEDIATTFDAYVDTWTAWEKAAQTA